MKPRILAPAELAAVLRDMADVVEARDSFEGRITYEVADNVPAPAYIVEAFYRVGNSTGQGGVQIVGEM